MSTEAQRPSVDHENGPPRGRESVSCGEAGDAGADDDHVGLGVGIEPGERGERGGGRPVGRRIASGGCHGLRYALTVGPNSDGDHIPCGNLGMILVETLGQRLARYALQSFDEPVESRLPGGTLSTRGEALD